MNKNKKSLQDLTLLDRFLFAEVMEDSKTFENVLSIILGKDISVQGKPQSEHEKRTSPLKRHVRLDVWAEDEADSVYNIEAQKENTNNLPHRSRFYQALIDSKLLAPGEIDFSNMKDCYSIIIAPFDLFGKQLYQYTFQMTCNETGQPLNDGSIRIFSILMERIQRMSVLNYVIFYIIWNIQTKSFLLLHLAFRKSKTMFKL